MTDTAEDSISVSSDSSEELQESSDRGATTEENEDTDADDLKIMEKPRRKRIRGMYQIFPVKTTVC